MYILNMTKNYTKWKAKNFRSPKCVYDVKKYERIELGKNWSYPLKEKNIAKIANIFNFVLLQISRLIGLWEKVKTVKITYSNIILIKLCYFEKQTEGRVSFERFFKFLRCAIEYL